MSFIQCPCCKPDAPAVGPLRQRIAQKRQAAALLAELLDGDEDALISERNAMEV